MNQNLFAALSCIQFIIIVGGLLMIVFNKQLKAFEVRTARRFRAWKRKVRKNICTWLMQKDGVVMEPVTAKKPKADADALMRLLTEET